VSAQYIEPRVIGDNVMCSCGSTMECIAYTDLENGGEWVWWRCLRNYDHVTRTIPVPVSLVPMV
jgi:hypothetical protein